MGKINFKKRGDEHNFWQNYTDLMSGLLIVFIIASLVAYKNYRGYVDFFDKNGINKGNVNDIVVKAKLYNTLKTFQEAQESLNKKYFHYNKKYNRFECNVDVLFAPNRAVIPRSNYKDLINAGKELENILKKFSDEENIAFKVIIDGRAAKRHGTIPTTKQYRAVETLSYNRARNLCNLWKENGILKDLSSLSTELFISGSGFGGQGRYKGKGKNGEDKNKTFIIQIVPYIKNTL